MIKLSLACRLIGAHACRDSCYSSGKSCQLSARHAHSQHQAQATQGLLTLAVIHAMKPKCNSTARASIAECKESTGASVHKLLWLQVEKTVRACKSSVARAYLIPHPPIPIALIGLSGTPDPSPDPGHAPPHASLEHGSTRCKHSFANSVLQQQTGSTTAVKLQRSTPGTRTATHVCSRQSDPTTTAQRSQVLMREVGRETLHSTHHSSIVLSH